MEPAEARRVYYIDANSLLECARRFNDVTRFRGIWEPLADMVRGGRLRTAQQVADETRKKSALLTEWMAGLDGFAIPTSDLWDGAKAITHQFPHLVGEEPGTAGDPWLVALAVRHEAVPVGMFDAREMCFVVTEETDRRHPQRVTRITEVCSQLGIDCINLWGMFEREGWRVGLILDDT